MELNPIFQVPELLNNAHETGLTAVLHKPMVEAVEQIKDRRSSTRRRNVKNRFTHVPDRLLRDIATFSPEARYCAKTGNC